jgi:hypothetical protein
MVRYFFERVVLLASVVALVSLLEWLVALALGLQRSQWTLLGTVFGLLVALRLWIDRKPPARPASRIRSTAARLWQAHVAWPTIHPVLGAASDGLVIFTAVALWSLLLTQPDDLWVGVAAECGAVVFAFGAVIGVIATRRARRRCDA